MSLISLVSASKNNPLSTLLTQAGLNTNLKLLLDAGDSASYSSGQVWNDVSGQGLNFNRGTTGSGESSDPTFNGTAGKLSSSEFFGVNGSQFLTNASANPTWMENVHKNNAAFTMGILFQVGDLSATQVLAADSNLASSTNGFFFQVNTSGVVSFTIHNSSGTVALTTTLSGVSALTWYLFLVSIDEAAGGTASHKQLNSAITAFDGTYASPSAGASAGAMKICGRPSGSSSMTNGGKVAAFAAWDRALSQSETTAFYNCVKTRMPI